MKETPDEGRELPPRHSVGSELQSPSRESQSSSRSGGRTGKVKFYNSKKVFGTFAAQDGGPDVFVHATAVEAGPLLGMVEGENVIVAVEVDSRQSPAVALAVEMTAAESPSKAEIQRFRHSVVQMFAAAEEAIGKIDHAVTKVAENREAIAKQKSVTGNRRI